MPRLSVVVPCYGVEAYVAGCLDSILAGSGDSVEVVAVDDASPDGCATILAEYARRDTRVRVVSLPVNGGLGAARNAGLDRATGEYVWFVDADDRLPPGAVTAVLERLTGTKPDVLIVNHAEGRRVAGVPTDIPAPVRLAERPDLLRLAQSACTKVIRRPFLDDIGLRFPPGWYEDCAFSHLLLMAAARIDVLDRVCYLYRQGRPGAITVTRSARHIEVFDQYAYLFDRAAEEFRPELFRVVVNHCLVIAGSRSRLPNGMRRAFFHRLAAEYARLLPPDGYPVPQGILGLKHRLVRADAYRTYAALRLAYRTIRRG